MNKTVRDGNSTKTKTNKQTKLNHEPCKLGLWLYFKWNHDPSSNLGVPGPRTRVLYPYGQIAWRHKLAIWCPWRPPSWKSIGSISKSSALGVQLVHSLITLLSFCTEFTIHQIAVFIVHQPQELLAMAWKKFISGMSGQLLQ